MMYIYIVSVTILTLVYAYGILVENEQWSGDEFCEFLFITLTPGLNTVAVLWLAWISLTK